MSGPKKQKHNKNNADMQRAHSPLLLTKQSVCLCRKRDVALLFKDF